MPASAAPTAAKQRAGVLALCVVRCWEGRGGGSGVGWVLAVCMRHLQLQQIDRETRCVGGGGDVWCGVECVYCMVHVSS